MTATNVKLQIEVVPVAEVPTEDIVAVPKRTRPVVLIVDDERVIADTLAMILSRSGFSTLTAYDGLTGLETAQDALPDLLISDVVMPVMTGVELAIAVTQMIPTCKILLFSGQAAAVDLLKEARNAGHNFTTLTKPVHPTDMLQRISECLATPKTTFPHTQSTDDSLDPAIVLVH
ncbi:response regulator [Tunturibacter empetritectus]|uniref:CheY-like chemotaxis protein n=1 Tax=Tunturiibacter lichenicola TaxID=2051959 RepID=A0A7W8JB22_9BACT|nr:response regulator [Edaphobacter lichenicola]MBB5344766.1 CheY-like chemotaxis protein [Edaphobacter lichenicola]